MASTNRPDADAASAIRAPVLLMNGSKTTSTTPRMAAEARACPDGNDSLVSVTSRKSTGGRSPTDRRLAEP